MGFRVGGDLTSAATAVAVVAVAAAGGERAEGNDW